jgi:hypothetical protein
VNFFKNKEDLPKLRVVGLRLRLSDGVANEWSREITGEEEKTVREAANQLLKECHEAIENAKTDNKITVLLPCFGLIRMECFKDILLLMHDKA